MESYFNALYYISDNITKNDFYEACFSLSPTITPTKYPTSTPSTTPSLQTTATTTTPTANPISSLPTNTPTSNPTDDGGFRYLDYYKDGNITYPHKLVFIGCEYSELFNNIWCFGGNTGYVYK